MQFLFAIFVALLTRPLAAQGSGPADFGILNYPILAIWLFFMLSVVIYPAAVLVYLYQRWRALAEEKSKTATGTPSLGGEVFRKALISHVVLTVAGTIFLVWG